MSTSATAQAGTETGRLPLVYLSQEDLLESGCLDCTWAADVAESALKAFADDRVLFPEKIVQIFNQETQERINCLPATLLDEKVCGVKWVSVFPPNVPKFGLQNLTAVVILSEIEKGFPLAIMEGTLASNLRVAAMGGVAARYLAPQEPKVIGFLGAGEQAKMHLLMMKALRPSLETCRVSAKTADEEQTFIRQLQPLVPDMTFKAADTVAEKALRDADILVTATSAQAPLLKADWMKPGTFYSHIGGWEDEDQVALQCDKIVCDDWETVKHRTQTLSRMYKAGTLSDDSIHGNLVDIVLGHKAGRESESERIYFNAVGLAYVDIALAHAMYQRALQAGKGRSLDLQQTQLFDHDTIESMVRL